VCGGRNGFVCMFVCRNKGVCMEEETRVVEREPGVYGRRESSMWRERWKCLCIGRNGCCGHVCEQGKRLFLFGCGSTHMNVERLVCVYVQKERRVACTGREVLCLYACGETGV